MWDPQHLTTLWVSTACYVDTFYENDYVWWIWLDAVLVYLKLKAKVKLHGLSPRANYTDRATAACRRNDCQLLRIEGATWSA
jgi:hypothetical protein